MEQAVALPQNGQPRSDADAAFLERFDHYMRVPIIASAILPLIVVPENNGWLGVVVGITTWLVFLVDYVVRSRHVVHYGRTRYGRFDLFVVVATAPWFLIPGAGSGRFVVVLRLARLARVVMASKGSRRLFEQLGRVAIVAASVTVVGSLVAYYAEHPTNSEFANVGDALWWGIVTLTTVGYGDIVPKTPTGRWAAVAIMLTGIAVLGTLAGSLASFFRLDQDRGADATASGGTDATPPGGVPDSEGPPVGASDESAIRALATEVAALRLQVASLVERLGGTPSDVPDAGGSGQGTAD